jgi:N-methylhydantoinase A
MRVGVEVGGTFTDLVVLDRGRINIAKVPSTPARPDEGALAAIEAAGIDLARVEDLVHGSTVATNAILERKGAPVCFVVTRGFRDVLLLQRHNRRQIYNLAYAKPKPVVQRKDVVEIDERLAADGSVSLPLDERAAAEALRQVLGNGRIQSCACSTATPIPTTSWPWPASCASCFPSSP